MSTKSRLQAMTAELVIPDFDPQPKPIATASTPENPVETRFPPVAQRPSGFKTGPGQMLAFRGQMLEVEGELASLRAQLEKHAGSMPTKKMDPLLIEPSRWANRHSASYATAAFIRLKEDIAQAGGNVQPILVRPKTDDPNRYEIVFGHRRHRACKELGIQVLAAICTTWISDLELFAAMDRENRERADLSNFEQGVMYQRAIDEGLFPSKRRLAESLGVSHTWVNSALGVANLPIPILDCFKTPLEVTHRHAKLLTAALEAEPRQILKRAEKIRGKQLSAAGVLSALLDSQKSKTQTRVLTALGQPIGKIQRKGNSVLMDIKTDNLSDEKLGQLQAFVEALISGNQVSTRK